VFEPHRVNWTVPTSMRRALADTKCLKLGAMIVDTPGKVVAASMAQHAFSADALVCIATNVFPDCTSEQWARHACPGSAASSVPASVAPNGDYDACKAWHVVFKRQGDVGLVAPMMDTLFKPSQLFLRTSLLPDLGRLAAWTCPGPRIAVHVRTFAVDGE
jgi:hypothetical protein